MKSKRFQSLQARLLGPLVVLLVLFTFLFGYASWSFHEQYVELTEKIKLTSEVARHAVEVTRIRARIQQLLFGLQSNSELPYQDELVSLNTRRRDHLDRIQSLTKETSKWSSLGAAMAGGIEDAAFLQNQMIKAIQNHDPRRAEAAHRQLSTIFEINSSRLKDFTMSLENDLQNNMQSLQTLLIRTFWIFIGILVFLALSIWGITLLYGKHVLIPLRLLHHGFQSLSRGEMNSQVHLRTAPGEIWEMTQDFNSMAKSLRATQIDLTRAREAALSAVQVKSDFLANMSHEIRTPLNTIVGISEELKDMNPTPAQKEYIDILNKGAQVLLNIVNDILDFSKLEDGNIRLIQTPLDLHQLAERISAIVVPMARKKNIRFDFEFLPNQPCWVHGDAKRLEQIFLNLLGNAVKFTESGLIQVQVQSRTVEEQVSIEIKVRDTGIGIPDSDLGSIFERFTQSDSSLTRKHGGTGLGLSIVKQLVGLMNGTISVQSKLGQGSEFTVHLKLPRANQERTLTELTGPSDSHPLPRFASDQKKASILLVDDAKDNRTLIQIYFKHSPFEFTTAENGQEAFQLFEQKKFDLILMDMQMPVMDGYEATRKIRQLEKQKGSAETPIVALSAYSMPDEVTRGRLAGCNDYLTKPVRKNELFSVIGNLIPRGSPSI
jgi:signal transduction histidine kinase/CheY-like chemotaxis protein